MGGNASGALNARGFSEALQQNILPNYNHITHSGIFNENYFSVGKRSENLLDVHHGLAISNCDLYDLPSRNYFLSLFLKSSTDGQKRSRPLNVVIALDVSGSMDGLLKFKNYEEIPVPQKTRIYLAKQAILMLFNKLEADDVFSLITFHNSAKTIIQSTFVKDLNPSTVRQLVNQKFQSGGTTISSGFNEALKNIKQFKQKHTINHYQIRIVLLTDVNDNSVQGSEQLVQQISQAGVSTTIIGVSSDFKSQTCQKLIKVKGFNYLCAVQEDDLQTYLVDQFDYTFFPCVQNIIITIQSQIMQQIQVFGSVDYDVIYQVQGNVFTVTKMSTGFPSALTLNKKRQVQTKGGLILVKFKPKSQNELPKIQIKINLEYSDMNGKQFSQKYVIDKLIQIEQYYSDEAVEKGVSLYYYTQTNRNILKDMLSGERVLSDSNKGFYLDKLRKLQQFCPQYKKQELLKLTNIVQAK